MASVGEKYEIYVGCMKHYIENMEKAQLEIYKETKIVNESSKRLMKAIQKSIGHIKDFHA